MIKTKTHVYTCPTCKSLDVDCQMWVGANTDAVGAGTERYNWCNACDRDGFGGELSFNEGLPELPIAETREAIELAKIEAELSKDDPAAHLQMEWEAPPLQELRELIRTATEYEAGD